jgi:hypothetical protein
MMAQTRVREKVSVTTVKESSAPFGLSYLELAAAAIAIVLLTLVIVYYFTALKPEKDRQAILIRTRDDLQKTETQLRASLGQDVTVQHDAAKDALASLEAFKAVHLKNLAQGRIALIDSINSLAKKNGVQLASGISMDAEKPAQQDDKNNRKRSATNLLNVYPKIKVGFSVAGEYGKLRTFINELEANKQFVTIDSVTLSAVKEREAGSGRGRRANYVLSGISLAIDMTAYFQH